MNRYFKTLFFTLVPFVLGFFVCYLLGSFLCVSFDPSVWEPQARGLMAFFGFVWGCGLYCKLMVEGLV
jgi:hypothetical protein